MVVVVTTHLEGFFGSGMRFDCENLREPRLVMASSERNVSSTLVKRTRCGVNGRLVMRVENKSLKSLVNGRSSSVMRNIFEDVWCMRPWLLSIPAMWTTADRRFLFSRAAVGMPLILLCGRSGRGLGGLERLLEDETVRREGLCEVPMEARLARAVDVLSRAKDANERRLRLRERLVEGEWAWVGRVESWLI